MKKIIPFITTALLMFCIVPTAATLAMPRNVPNKNTALSNPPNAILSVLNHKGLTDMITELSNQGIKDTILTYDPQKHRETTIAQGGKSTTATSTGKTNPHVKRRGHGKSKMGDAVAVEDNNSKNGGNEDEEEDDGEMEEDEEPDDDPAIKYNKGLKNSSGYNEDL